jgi:hypothetical protein
VKRAEARCSRSGHALAVSASASSRLHSRHLGVPPPRGPPLTKVNGGPRGLATAGRPTLLDPTRHRSGWPCQAGTCSRLPRGLLPAASGLRPRLPSVGPEHSARLAWPLRPCPPVPKYPRPVTSRPRRSQHLDHPVPGRRRVETHRLPVTSSFEPSGDAPAPPCPAAVPKHGREVSLESARRSCDLGARVRHRAWTEVRALLRPRAPHLPATCRPARALPPRRSTTW